MFLSYKAKVENQLNRKIKRLRFDKGSEYTLFNNFCEKECIIHEVTPPYSPESNGGVVERKNRTLKEMLNALFLSSSVLNNLLGEALLTACFLQNRISHKRTGLSPYELWKGYKPNLKYLRVWGCLAKVMLPDPKKRKIGSKTSDCLFIGYTEHSAAYRFLVLKSDTIECDTIVEIKNVELFEDVFPLRTSACSSTISSLEQLVKTYTEPIREDLKRSKRHRTEKSFGDDFYTYLIKDDPLSFSEAISSSDANLWEQAIGIEIDSIEKNNTWTLVDLLEGANPIGCKWIFKRKCNPDGSTDKYKARLVAKGFTQKPNIDFFIPLHLLQEFPPL